MNTLQQLKRESTFLTFFLNVITLGIYGTHYMKTQTEILNDSLPESKRMDTTTMGALISLAWVSGIFSLITTFSELNQGLNALDTFLGFGVSIAMLAWVFKWRTMFHEVMNIANSDDGRWLNGVLTLLFGIYYINYKINSLNDYVKS